MEAPEAAHEFETQFLEQMRGRYESDGYTFKIAPSSDELPEFLSSYRPDAIAKKTGQNIAIEVRQRQTSASQAMLRRLRQLFDGHPDWKLRVVYAGSGPNPELSLGSVTDTELRSQLQRVEGLNHAGEHQAALVMAWALLEATLRTVDADSASKPRTPGTVVQTLAMDGYIDDVSERSLRGLIELRNRTVHGDLDAPVSTHDVDTVLKAVRQVLASTADRG